MARVTVEQLIKPQGDIDVALLFPADKAEDVTAMIAGWISKAEKIATAEVITDDDKVNDLAEAYVYYKAYNDVHTRMSANPIKAGVSGEADQAFDIEQIREFAKKAALYLDNFNALLLSAAGEPAIEPKRSRSLTNNYRW